MLCAASAPILAIVLSTIIRLSDAHQDDQNARTLRRLNALHPDAPTCMSSLPSLCPTLYDFTLACSEAGDEDAKGGCYCASLLNTKCSRICLGLGQPVAYLAWTQGLCTNSKLLHRTFGRNSTSANFKALWPDHLLYRRRADASLLPWQWKLTPDRSNFSSKSDGSATKPSACAPPHKIFLSLAIDNIWIAIMSLISSSRHVISFLTFGWFGNPGSYNWPLMAFLPISVNLLSNLANSVLVHYTSGYGKVPLGGMFLLWLTRPRLSWLVILVALNFRCGRRGPDGGYSNTYICSAVTSMAAEMILQVIGAPYLLMTLHHAREQGFATFDTRLNYAPSGAAAQRMYAGALLWLISLCLLSIVVLHTITSAGMVFEYGLAATFRCIESYWRRSTKQARKFKQSLRDEEESQENFPLTDQSQTSIPAVAQPKAAHLAEQEAESQVEGAGSNANFNRPDDSCRGESSPASTSVPTKKELRAKQKRERQRDKRKKKDEKECRAAASAHAELVSMGFKAPLYVAYDLSLFFVLAFLLFVSQWIFWVGYVELAWHEQSYCPPKVWTATGIWALGSGLGALFGGGKM